MKRLFLVVILFPVLSWASPTKVGNGDDGADLEKLQKVESGILVTTRDKAFEILNNLNVRSVMGLGTLASELKQADLYIVQNNIQNPKDFDKGMETSEDGKMVYARTIAQPYSPVRFFPAALTLSEEQLVRLHIHEALHRALPENIREDESAVSEITLALTSPTANRDSIELVTARYLRPVKAEAVATQTAMISEEIAPKQKAPSLIRYSYQVFDMKSSEKDLYPVQSMHRLDSFLYPFGGPASSLGLGLTFSYLSFGSENVSGPLQVSARRILSTVRGFDVEAYLQYSMYTVSGDILKNTPQSRDAGTLGLSIRKDTDRFYSENYISVTMGPDKEFNLGNVKYIQKYSPIITAKVGVGAKLNHFFIGAGLDLCVTEGSYVTSETESFSSDKERIYMYKFGPEAGFNYEHFQWSVYGRMILDRNSKYSLSDFGDLMGQGAGQGFIGTSLAYNF